MGAFKAQPHNLSPHSFSKTSLFKVPSRPNSYMMDKYRGLIHLFRQSEKEDPGDSPGQQPEELHPFQPAQDGEWQSWASGLMAAASLAPSHPIPSHPNPTHGDMARDRTEEGPGTHPTALCSIPWGIPGLSLPGERRAGLCSPACQLWLCSLFARCSHGLDTTAGTHQWPLPQNTEGTCSHPHLGWACCRCSAQHIAWSTPWNIPLFLPFVLRLDLQIL